MVVVMWVKQLAVLKSQERGGLGGGGRGHVPQAQVRGRRSQSQALRSDH